MYVQAFGLHDNPFRLSSDPAVLFLSESHRDALAGLYYGLLDRKGLLVLLGKPGTGKTTLLARTVQMLAADRVRFGLILNPILTPAEFFEMLLLAFGVAEIPASKARRMVELARLLRETQSAGKIAALLIDEAHRLSPQLLEEIRLLGNLEQSGEKLLQVVLAGQEELATVLNRRNLLQFKQRVALRLSLRPLTASELEQYIRFRWMHAGGAENLPFTRPALQRIAQHSEGIPRLVNAICDNALRLTLSEETVLVESRHVLRACADLELASAAPCHAPAPQSSNGRSRQNRQAGGTGEPKGTWMAGMATALLLAEGDVPGAVSRLLGESTGVQPSQAAVPPDAGRVEEHGLGRAERVLALEMCQGALAEKYRQAASNVLRGIRRPSLLLVSSPDAGEGKTVTGIHLAATLAGMTRQNVLLVDGHRHGAAVHTYLHVEREPGLADVLHGACRLPDAIWHSEQLPNLYCLTAGRAANHSAVLPEPENWRAFADGLRQWFSWIVIDGPPIAAATEGGLAGPCDAILLVLRPDHTRRDSCVRAMQAAGEKLIGVILNGC